jgi:hypothetical protein
MRLHAAFRSLKEYIMRTRYASRNVMWHVALKSERFDKRRRLIKHLRVATRHNAINKSTWSQPRKLAALAFLTLLEWEMRRQKTALLNNFAAQANANKG